MSITDKVRKLVSEGRTQLALDTLQAELNQVLFKDLINQTYLLEGQFKDLTKKGDLGLDDVSVDINRINMALLRICDEIEAQGGQIAAETDASTPTEKSYMSQPLVVFGGLTGVAALIIALIMGLGGDKEAAPKPTIPQTVSPRFSVVFDTTAQTFATKNKSDIQFKILSAHLTGSSKLVLTVSGRVRCQGAPTMACPVGGAVFKLALADKTTLATAQASSLPELMGGQGAAFTFDFEVPARAQTLSLAVVNAKNVVLMQQRLELVAE